MRNSLLDGEIASTAYARPLEFGVAQQRLQVAGGGSPLVDGGLIADKLAGEGGTAPGSPDWGHEPEDRLNESLDEDLQRMMRVEVGQFVAQRVAKLRGVAVNERLRQIDRRLMKLVAERSHRLGSHAKLNRSSGEPQQRLRHSGAKPILFRVRRPAGSAGGSGGPGQKSIIHFRQGSPSPPTKWSAEPRRPLAGG